MKKILLVLLAAAMFVLSLAACGGNGSNNGNNGVSTMVMYERFPQVPDFGALNGVELVQILDFASFVSFLYNSVPQSYITAYKNALVSVGFEINLTETDDVLTRYTGHGLTVSVPNSGDGYGISISVRSN